MNILKKFKEKRRQKKNIVYQMCYMTWLAGYAKHEAYIKAPANWSEKRINQYTQRNVDTITPISEYRDNQFQVDRDDQFFEFNKLPMVDHHKTPGKFYTFKHKILKTYD